MLEKLYSNIKEYPNFPKEGVLFKDILPLLKDPFLRKDLVTEMSKLIPSEVTCIVAPESRGFLLGMLVAQELNLKFIPVRKPGKLPGEVKSISYSTEYSLDTLEVQQDSLNELDKYFFIDDIYATGGTYKAIKDLLNTNRFLGGLVLLDVLGNKEPEIISLFGGLN